MLRDEPADCPMCWRVYRKLVDADAELLEEMAADKGWHPIEELRSIGVGSMPEAKGLEHAEEHIRGPLLK